VARDQRTRLNAELAHQYGGALKRGAEPGRGSLTGELVEKQDVAPDGAELEEQELEGQDSVEQEVEPAPRKSLFELPRKEPSRQPLLASPFGAQPTTPASPAAPDAPGSTTPKAPRRG
jgi:hypothetical protein